MPEGASSAANGPKQNKRKKSGEKEGRREGRGGDKCGLCKWPIFFQLESLRFANAEPKEIGAAVGEDKIAVIFKRLEISLSSL